MPPQVAASPPPLYGVAGTYNQSYQQQGHGVSTQTSSEYPSTVAAALGTQGSLTYGDPTDSSSYEPHSRDSKKPHSRDSKKHRCPYLACSSAFNRKADRDRHVSVLHERNATKYPCKMKKCNRKGKYAFTRAAHLTEHMQSYHQKEAPSNRRNRRTDSEDEDEEEEEGHKLPEEVIYGEFPAAYASYSSYSAY
jgi:hypothetical protein